MNVTEALPNLPAPIACQIGHVLIASLPAPRGDTPECRADRDTAAIAAVAALRPANAFEALLAADIVGVSAHAMDCLRLAVQPGQAVEETLRIRARAGSLMHQMQAQLRSLQRIQAERELADARSHVVVPLPVRAKATRRAGHRSGDVAGRSRAKLRIVH